MEVDNWPKAESLRRMPISDPSSARPDRRAARPSAPQLLTRLPARRRTRVEQPEIADHLGRPYRGFPVAEVPAEVLEQLLPQQAGANIEALSGRQLTTMLWVSPSALKVTTWTATTGTPRTSAV